MAFNFTGMFESPRETNQNKKFWRELKSFIVDYTYIGKNPEIHFQEEENTGEIILGYLVSQGYFLRNQRKAIEAYVDYLDKNNLLNRVLRTRNRKGETPLETIISRGDVKVFTYIMKKNIDLENIKTLNRESILSYLARFTSTDEDVESLQQDKAMLQELLLKIKDVGDIFEDWDGFSDEVKTILLKNPIIMKNYAEQEKVRIISARKNFAEFLLEVSVYTNILAKKAILESAFITSAEWNGKNKRRKHPINEEIFSIEELLEGAGIPVEEYRNLYNRIKREEYDPLVKKLREEEAGTNVAKITHEQFLEAIQDILAILNTNKNKVRGDNLSGVRPTPANLSRFKEQIYFLTNAFINFTDSARFPYFDINGFEKSTLEAHKRTEAVINKEDVIQKEFDKTYLMAKEILQQRASNIQKQKNNAKKIAEEEATRRVAEETARKTAEAREKARREAQEAERKRLEEEEKARKEEEEKRRVEAKRLEEFKRQEEQAKEKLRKAYEERMRREAEAKAEKNRKNKEKADEEARKAREAQEKADEEARKAQAAREKAEREVREAREKADREAAELAELKRVTDEEMERLKAEIIRLQQEAILIASKGTSKEPTIGVKNKNKEQRNIFTARLIQLFQQQDEQIIILSDMAEELNKSLTVVTKSKEEEEEEREQKKIKGEKDDYDKRSQVDPNVAIGRDAKTKCIVQLAELRSLRQALLRKQNTAHEAKVNYDATPHQKRLQQLYLIHYREELIKLQEKMSVLLGQCARFVNTGGRNLTTDELNKLNKTLERDRKALQFERADLERMGRGPETPGESPELRMAKQAIVEKIRQIVKTSRDGRQPTKTLDELLKVEETLSTLFTDLSQLLENTIAVSPVYTDNLGTYQVLVNAFIERFSEIQVAIQEEKKRREQLQLSPEEKVLKDKEDMKATLKAFFSGGPTLQLPKVEPPKVEPPKEEPPKKEPPKKEPPKEVPKRIRTYEEVLVEIQKELNELRPNETRVIEMINEVFTRDIRNINNTLDDDENTLLLILLRSKMIQASERLIQLGANVNQANSDGLTPLMIAILTVNPSNIREYGAMRILSTLLQHRDINTNIFASDGMDAYNYATSMETAITDPEQRKQFKSNVTDVLYSKRSYFTTRLLKTATRKTGNILKSFFLGSGGEKKTLRRNKRTKTRGNK